MEYDIEEILYNFEDDYNPGPRPMNQGPRNMYDDKRMGFGRGLKVLNKTERKNILNWGKNTSNGEWSFEKTFKEYDKTSRDRRFKIRTGVTTGVGDPGFKKKGDVRLLTKEQQKLWDATMADTVGKWEDYGNANRGNWLRDVDQKLDKFKQTKNLLSRKELGDFLTKEIGVKFNNNKIFGRRYSLVSGENKSKFGQFVDDKLFAMEFADGQQKYYKKPTDTQIKFIKENLLQNVQKNSLNTNTLNTIKKIDKLYGPIYKSGNLPNLKSVMEKLNLTGNQIAYAEAQLARIYGGHKFVNGPDIRVNNKTANSMFDIIAKSEFGNPRKTQVYELSLDIIDEGLGNEKGTFRDLKNKALQILKDNKIDVYDPKKGKKAFGFNIDELAGVTGSGKSKNMGVSQFINVMEGNLNTKELQSFQGGLSKARTAVEGAKGTPFYSRVLKEQMERINTRALGLEKKHGIKLARLQKPADINNMTAKEVKRLKNINLGTGEDLYQRLVKDAKASGYSIKMPPETLTIQEFVDPKNADQIKNMLADLGCPKSLQKASGGRIKYSKGTSCHIKGREVLEKGLKNGFPKNQQGDLARKILGTGKFLKDAVSLRGLFGPAALAFTVAAEAGIVGYDILSGGKSFREAVGDSVFNYMLGDKTKIDSEEEFIKRLKNVPGSPGQGFRGFTDDDINKMRVFKSKLDDMQTGFSNYSDLLDINKKIEENTKNQQVNPELFPDQAFQLEGEKNRIQADIRDYNKVGTPRSVTNYMYSDKGTEGGDALARGTLLAKENQLLNAYRSSPKGIENLKKDLIDTRFNLEQMNNPTKYDEFGEYFISRPKQEQSRIMSYGYKEGGIASLNVNKK
jgi:hypothetical protein